MSNEKKIVLFLPVLLFIILVNATFWVKSTPELWDPVFRLDDKFLLLGYPGFVVCTDNYENKIIELNYENNKKIVPSNITKLCVLENKLILYSKNYGWFAIDKNTYQTFGPSEIVEDLVPSDELKIFERELIIRCPNELKIEPFGFQYVVPVGFFISILFPCILFFLIKRK